MKLGLMNVTIMTHDGEYTMHTVSLFEAIDRVNLHIDGIDSAIGHPETAAILSKLLDIEVSVNRQNFIQQIGQHALAIKLNGRLEAGKEMTLEEIQKMGYTFKFITRTA